MIKSQNISTVMPAELVILSGQVDLASAGTVSKLIGNGIVSVVKDETGVYSITLEKKFNRILNVITSIESATAHNIAQVNEFSNDGEVVVLNLFGSSFQVDDLAISGSVDGYAVDVDGYVLEDGTFGTITGTLSDATVSSSLALANPGADITLKFTIFAKDGSLLLAGE